MNPLIFIPLILFSFVVRTIRLAFYYTFLCQLKEYRIDRLTAHLETSQGRKLIFGIITLVKWILLISILVSSQLRIGILFRFSFWMFCLIWILEALRSIKELLISGWRTPKFTLKTLLILGIVFIFQFGLIILGLVVQQKFLLAQLLIGPFLDKLLGPSIIFLIVFLNIPLSLYKKWLITRARKKIEQFKHLMIIGITGSFGKTSTKEFLAQLLSAKYNVLKTEGSINTEIGIAQTVLLGLTSKHDVFIVEMGAYKKGEIAAICKIVSPETGVITGINQQHVQLFGSIEEILEGKFELIKSLKKNGIAVFNAGNKYVQKMVDWCRQQRPDLLVWKYQRLSDKEVVDFKKRKAQDNILYAYDIKVQPDKLSFKMLYKGQDIQCNAKLAGVAHVNNLLAATCVALKLGMTIEQIIKSISKIKAPAKTMRMVAEIKGAKFIDDTFNANPDGVIAALEYMQLFAGKKILVLTPLIELGEASYAIHRSLGRKAAIVCDLILLTNLNYNKPFIKGTSQIVGDGKKIQVVNTIVGEKIIRQHIDKDGVVVFEGKEAGKILEKLLIVNC